MNENAVKPLGALAVKASQPDAQQILQARAEQLAVEITGAEHDGESVELLEFCLGDESYAIESTCIREVTSARELTPLPCTPDFILGILNVHGQIVSVMDLARFFGLPAQEVDETSKIIIVYGAGMETGIVAAGVTGVSRIAVAEIQPVPSAFGSVHGAYLKGVTASRLAVLDTAALLRDDRIVVREEVG
jgi:purine-binding chemotaxis protein CheW